MVARARANSASKGYGKRIQFKQGSADHLPFDDSTQDFVVSTFSLNHWGDPQSAFKEIQWFLKLGGQMLIFDLRRDARRLFLWLMWFAQNIALRTIGAGALRRIDEPMNSSIASYTKKELEEIVKKTKFNDCEIKGKFGLIYLWAKKEEAQVMSPLVEGSKSHPPFHNKPHILTSLLQEVHLRFLKILAPVCVFLKWLKILFLHSSQVSTHER
jgi:SAM-dependent methyltransferase